MKKLFLLLFCSVIYSITTSKGQTTVNFSCTGAPVNWTVPPCVTSINVSVAGSQGGGPSGGLGATVTATIPVVPGQILQINVGCNCSGVGAGFNGGGSGQASSSAGDESFCGGGASDIRTSPFGLANRIIVAGGGGGMGGGTTDALGGNAGCASGLSGDAPFGIGGSGGTLTAGGAGGPPWIASGNPGAAGALGTGGAGGSDPCYNLGPGGGGGGGYYGGGGGGSDCFATSPLGGGGGGGGSCLTPAGGSCTGGNHTGTGLVSITYTASAAAPTVNSPTICAGSSATLTATGGTTYLWSTGATTNPITVAPAVTTSYTVTATSAGCTGTAVSTVTVIPSPTVNAEANLTYCAGTVVPANTFTSTPAGATFNWTNSNTAIGLAASGTTSLPSFTAGNATGSPITSTITVTPTIGACTGTPITFTITINSTPNVVVPASSTVCAGAAIPASAYTSGVAGTTFAWTNSNTTIGLAASGAGNTPAFTAANAGTTPITSTITVTPTAAGCTGTPVTYTITVNPKPNVVVPANITVCAGATVPASVFTSSVGGTTFAWTNSNATIGLAVSGAGNTPSFTAVNGTGTPITSTITVTPTASTCSGTPGTYSITVNPVPVITVNSPTICPGNTAVLTAAGGTTYLWSTGSSANPLSVTPAATTSYTVTGTTGGCSSTAVATVTVGAVLSVTVNSPTTCAGQTATLTAGGATTYAWTTGAITNPITVAPVTTTSYTVTGTTGGCSGSAVATVTVNPLPTVTVNSPTICAGQTANLTAGGAAAYVWSAGATSTGVTTATATPATTTTYTVTGTTAGCSNTAVSTVTVNPIPTVTVNSPSICPGSTANLVAGGATSYTWSAGATSTGVNTANATPASTTTYTVTGTTAGCSNTAISTVTVNSGLTPNAGPNDTICYGASTNLSVTPNGAGYTYSWLPTTGLSNPSIFNPIANPATTTTYTVTVTSGAGCSGTTTVQVFVDPQITLAIAGIAATCNGTCNGQTIVIPGGGTPTFTYVWSSGCTSAACNSVCAGSYTVTVTDALGCTLDTNTIVAQPTPITITMSAVTAHCGQPDGSATATPSGGTPGYTYLWSPGGQTTATAINLTPGTYSVTVTDTKGCTDTAGVIVPNAAGVIASIGAPTNTSCNGVCDGSATASGTGGTVPYTFSWNTIPVQTTATATALCAGTYIATVTDATGCNDTASITITQPASVTNAAITPVTICIGGNTTLMAVAGGGSGGYVYTWDAPGTPGFANTASVTVTPAATTTYTVHVVDANGCTGPNVSVVVTVNPPLSVVASGTTSICPGSSSPISAIANGGSGGPYTYTWGPIGTGTGTPITVSPVVTTTYTVVATDGCGSPPAVDSVTITVSPLPTVAFTSNIASGCTPVCVNFTDATTVTGGGSISSWNWSFSDGGLTSALQNPTHCFVNPGSYSITLTTVSNSGCMSTFTNTNMITVYPIPTASFTAPLSSSILNPIVQFTDNSSGATSWNWNFGDSLNSASNTSTQQNPIHTYTEVGTYCVTLTVNNAAGCTDNYPFCVVIDPEFTFYIPNAFSPNGDGINDEFYGKGENIKDYQMYIYDRWGNMIFYCDDINKHWDGTANHGSDIAQQDVYVYVVKITDNKDQKHKYIGSVTLVK